MRARTLIAAALIAGVWAAARSKPASESLDHNAAPGVSAAMAPGAVVSELEAGRDPTQLVPPPADEPAGAPVARKVRSQTVAARPEAVHHQHAVIPAEQPPRIEVTTAASTVNEPELVPAPLPGPVAAPGIRGAEEDLPRPMEPPARDRGRGPVILIRGGRGSPDDDCAIHGPRSRPLGGGIAINRSTPSRSGAGWGGGSGGVFRGGIR